MKKLSLVLGIMSLTLMLSGCGSGEKESKVVDYHTDLFGENVYFFSPEDDINEVQKTVDEIYKKQEENQFGDERYSLYFLPGTYDEGLDVNVGFYTQVAGLGEKPTDTVIPNLTCLARWLGDDSNHMALCNFWRGVENLEMQANKTVWAVSQATDMRRVQIDGSLYLHDEYGWASGGFLADSKIERMVDSGSQQQWLSRNDEYTTWMNQNWNIVFMGDDPDGVPDGTWPNFSYTRVDETRIVREKPFLTCKDGKFFVFVPDFRTDSVGPSWNGDSNTPGELLPIEDFYVAKEEADDADSIQEALDKGKHIFFTPGVYELSHPLSVEKEGTILLGSGLATLWVGGDSETGCLETSAADLIVAGLLMDAGSHDTKQLFHIKKPVDSKSEIGHQTQISDIYFRIGGINTPEPVRTENCLLVDDDLVIGDNLWVWRADHGDQVAWDKNVTKNGVIINGDDVSMYGLMVEHFHEYQTIWNGEGGRLVMYQSEVPYDVPSPEVWKSHDGSMDGFASICVGEDVKSFEADGIGIYLYNRDAAVPLHAAMETPTGEGIDIRHIITVLLNGNPGMEHVINDTGGAVMQTGEKQMVLHYKGGEDIRFD